MDNKELATIDELNENSLVFEQSIESILRRRTGSYYTSLALTVPMAKELIDNLPEIKRNNIHKLRFLEPCVGTGNFVIAYLLIASKYTSPDKYLELLNNIYVCDINTDALRKYKKQLTMFAREHLGITLESNYFDKHVGGGLLFDVTASDPEYIPIDKIFGKEAINSFEIIMTNPPYKNLKAESGHYSCEDEKSADKYRYDRIGRIAKSVLPLSSIGVINLYKLFVEEIIERYAAKDALVSLLIPSSILTDKTCEKIRARIINNHHIVSVKNIPENNQFIDAQQALTALLLDKDSDILKSGRLTGICKEYMDIQSEPTYVNLKTYATADNGYTILALSESENSILEAMNKHPKLKDIQFITNLRGELDLTVNKKYMVHVPTAFKLIRGRDIGMYKLSSQESIYVDEEFVKISSKGRYIHNERLACQQISNIAKDRRLTFSKVAAGNVLANSCNFLYVDDNEHGINIDYILGLMNSKLMNWYFKIHSSNNHINNYELDNLPIPISGNNVKKIAKLAKDMQVSQDASTLNEIDDLIGELFGVTNNITNTKVAPTSNNMDELAKSAFVDMRYLIPNIQTIDALDLLNNHQSTDAIILKYNPSISKFDKNVFNGIVDKYQKLTSNLILNHTTFKLSDLDLEMIRPIPQGGNWKNIPENTINKSRRLKRITETGGRTTLYGRLHYEKPSYTITTYFNRPGNGTYVHPIHDRVLSVREAARFQAFPDNYYFYGNKTQLLKQIGNAVPTLLAYQIGKKIVDKLGSAKSLDLFCGAGGLTSGFKNAGIDTTLCTDFDEAACTTIKINNPESNVICGDITDPTIKELINQSAIESGADIVCGGPPCQGFSMAGYRDENDPRNQLFKEFVSVVEKVKPKIVLFENVEGILTFKNGETYDAIHELFAELGYKTEGRLLKTDKYGVPQKRKRVIIICTRNDVDINPADLYPDEITSDERLKITVSDSIRDLESIECSDDARYDDKPILSTYNRMLRGMISISDFLASLSSPTSSNQPVQQSSLFDVN